MLKSKIKNFSLFLILGTISLFFTQNATASSTPEETAFIFNTLLFLICGFLVMWMAAGFAMLEAGMVRTKNVSAICLKNVGLYSISGVMFYLVGYNLAYGIPEGGYMGSFSMFVPSEDMSTGYASHSDWFFQMVFCATTVSIVSGTVAERIKVWSFFIFAALLAGIIYPIEMGWQWGGGWLASMGFSDFAGSTLVHSTGGAAALAGIIVLGARSGRFDSKGQALPIKPFAASSIPLVTVGVFILWLGWFGFNGGSQLALGSFADAIAISTIFINTNLAACGGVLAAAVLTRLMFGKTDVVQMLNGAIGGLVAITAEPLAPSPFAAILIGAVGGMIVIFGTKILFNFKLDDVVGAIPAHLFSGIWGTLAVPFTNADASFSAQLIGVLSINIFVFIVAYVIWFFMKNTFGIRVSKEAETKGTDVTETGVIAYAIRD